MRGKRRKLVQKGKVGIRNFGVLESEIMAEVWQREECTVRDIFDALRSQKKIAYTTIMTVMGRLAEKGILSRKKVQNAYIYKAKVTREEIARGITSDVVEKILDGNPDILIGHLLGLNGEIDPKQIEKIKKQFQANKAVKGSA